MSRANRDGGAVLVTGASGFLGSRTVAVLSKQGYSVRALARKTSRIDHLRLPNVTIFRGDVVEAESLRSAFEGAEFVIHAAAGTGGSEAEGKMSTVLGTKNILALSNQYGVKKLVYISSCNVYGIADCKQGQVVTEESPLERFPEKRGHYTHAKLEAEQRVTRAMKNGRVTIVTLRPGTIYGPGGDIFTPMVGFSLGKNFFAVIGDGSFILPLVYVDNMVEAIIAAINQHSCMNQIYNVVDPRKVTKREYMEGLVKKVYPGSGMVYVPFGMLKMAVAIQEKLCAALKRRPFLTTYRLLSSQKPVVYDASKISTELSWKPPVAVETAFKNVIEYESGRN